MIKTEKAFDFIKIKLASPNRIKEWGQRLLNNGKFVGKIICNATINYRTFKPEMDGLFCERIFGPSKNWECYCGKYKQIRYSNLICDRCGVEVTESKVRRYRMGYISLNSPVTHIWYLRSIPSFIPLILNEKRKDIEQSVYLVGSDKLKCRLDALDVYKESLNVRAEISVSKNENELKIAFKRLRVLENFKINRSNPSWMILTNIPVIPPDLRPMIKMENGRFATSDLNELYKNIIYRNNRLNELIRMSIPDFILINEKRMLQESVDSLIDNEKALKKSLGSNNRPLKSLSEIIKGKQGRFRLNLLGKRVDYSGRSVIVVGPNLKLNQCGLPYDLAVELFSPFIIHVLIKEERINNIKAAKKYIFQSKPIILRILKNLLMNHPILLNRAPTLHRLGIQAFEPVLVEGKAIKLHPLVCSAFNADFDGDQMAVHVPLSKEAQIEAYILMSTPYNFLSPATGEPVIIPSQDMILGCYYLTSHNVKLTKGYNNYFSNFNDVILAYESNKIDLHTLIWVRYNGLVSIPKMIKNKTILSDNTYIEHYLNLQCRKDKNGNILSQYIQTTPGRVIFNNTLKKILN